MNYYYGEKMPLRVLDEVEFWKRQEAEHTVVIKQITPGLEDEYVKLLNEWERAFTKTEGIAIEMVENVIRAKGNIDQQTYQDIINLVKFANNQSMQFVKLLDYLLKNSNAVLKNQIAQIVIKHIRRESEYFIGISNAILNN